MYCTSCGSQYPDNAKFCPECGKPIGPVSERSVDNVVNLQRAPTSSAAPIPTTENGITLSKRAIARPRLTYIWLGLEFVSAVGLIALALFWMARMVASGNPDIQNHVFESSGGGIVLIVVCLGLSQSWKRLKISEPDSEPRFRKKHRKLNQLAAVFLILCAAGAVWAGISQGSCDATVSVFGNDVKQSQAAMQAIGNARMTSNTTIEGYIQMYKSIEPQVAQEKALVSRLRTEIPPCGDFQPRAQGFERIINNLDQRLTLLSREIEVAKSIESLPPAEEQNQWQLQMLPLIDQEATLEKELHALFH